MGCAAQFKDVIERGNHLSVKHSRDEVCRITQDDGTKCAHKFTTPFAHHLETQHGCIATVSTAAPLDAVSYCSPCQLWLCDSGAVKRHADGHAALVSYRALQPTRPRHRQAGRVNAVFILHG